jgi:hypothetical protein
MQTNRVAEVHGEHQVDDGSGRETECLDLEKHTHGGQILGPTTVKPAPRYREVDRRRNLVSLQQTPFHRPSFSCFSSNRARPECDRAVGEIKSRFAEVGSRSALGRGVIIMSRGSRLCGIVPGAEDTLFI